VASGLLLGADGGNTKTVAVVAGRDGSILGAGRSGNSDLYNAPSTDAALASIAAAAAQALAAAGKVVGETMTGDRQRRLVEEFLAGAGSDGSGSRS